MLKQISLFILCAVAIVLFATPVPVSYTHLDVYKRQVLKDKSATELYGEKGKNGVILITLRDKEYPIVIGSKNTNSTSTTLRVKGTSKSSTLPGVQDVYVNGKKSDLGLSLIHI